MEKTKILIIVGPTASGKTKLSIELAKIFNGEIISADSMQIYKGMDIGTAKPTPQEMAGIAHHLLDFVPLENTFSVADFVQHAKEKIADITSRGKLPIICGGTGLYIDSLVNDVNFEEQNSNLEIRKNLTELYEKEGIEPLLERLAQIDKPSLERIHPNNVKRIIRAIEIYEATGVTMSEQIANSKLVNSPYEPIFIGLDFKNREILYSRINSRVDEMMKNGLLDEARKILSQNCSITAKSAICYKELAPYLEGHCSLEDAVENLKRATRRYAKRQLTWFRKNNSIEWFFADECGIFENLLKKCINHIDFFLNIGYNSL